MRLPHMADFISYNWPCPWRGWERAHNYGLLSSTSKVNKSEDKMTCSYVLSFHLQRQTCGFSEVHTGMSWRITALKSGPLKCIKSVFEILSAKHSSLHSLKGLHLFAHANQKHPNLTLACDFSIMPKTQAFPWLFKTHWVVYWHFYSKATLIIHIVPCGTNRRTVVN